MLYSDLNQKDPKVESLLFNLEAVLQSVRNIITTRPRTRFFNPEFGAGLEDYLFDPLDDITTAQIETLAFEAISRWDSRIKVDYGKSSVIPVRDENKYEIRLVFQIQGLQGRTFEHRGEITRSFDLPPAPAPLGLVFPTLIDNPPPPLARQPFVSIRLDGKKGPIPWPVEATSLVVDPDGVPVSWEWNWGDGTAHAFTQNSNHVYTVAGNYTVKLKVVDDQGLVAFSEQSVIALEHPEPPVAPNSTLYRVRNSSDQTVTYSFLSWNVYFTGCFTVAHVVDGIWDGTYRYLYPSTISVTLPNTYIARVWVEGSQVYLWRWGT